MDCLTELKTCSNCCGVKCSFSKGVPIHSFNTKFEHKLRHSMIERMQVRILYDHWFPKYIDVLGITLFPYILLAEKKSKIEYSLLRHEYVHIQQCRDLGFFYFYISYGLFYIYYCLYFRFDTNKAYHAVKYEIEAYATELDPFTPEQIKELEQLEVSRRLMKQIKRIK
jgi:hypothetical protein